MHYVKSRAGKLLRTGLTAVFVAVDEVCVVVEVCEEVVCAEFVQGVEVFICAVGE